MCLCDILSAATPGLLEVSIEEERGVEWLEECLLSDDKLLCSLLVLPLCLLSVGILCLGGVEWWLPVSLWLLEPCLCLTDDEESVLCGGCLLWSWLLEDVDFSAARSGGLSLLCSESDLASACGIEPFFLVESPPTNQTNIYASENLWAVCRSCEICDKQHYSIALIKQMMITGVSSTISANLPCELVVPPLFWASSFALKRFKYMYILSQYKDM